MTASLPEVEFHTGLADPGDYAARLLAKAWRRGAPVLCTAAPAALRVVSAALWQRVPGDFVAHALLPAADEATLRASRLWLAEDLAQADAAAARSGGGRPAILVHLGGDAPGLPCTDAASLQRVIELVGIDEPAVAAGRLRWRAWRGLGCTVRHVGGGGTAAATSD